MRRPTVAIALLAGAIAALASCSTTEPQPEPIQLDPVSLEGVWAVSTSLDTFSFETPAPSPDCPGAIMYCTHLRADTSGRLWIVMTIAGDSPTPVGVRPFRLVSASVWGSFCDQINSTSPPMGCTHVSPVGPTSYPSGTFTPSNDPLPAPGTVSITLGGPDQQAVRLTGVFAGDSIIGRLYWTQFVTRSPPAYYGSFRAIRQP